MRAFLCWLGFHAWRHVEGHYQSYENHAVCACCGTSMADPATPAA